VLHRPLEPAAFIRSWVRGRNFCQTVCYTKVSGYLGQPSLSTFKANRAAKGSRNARTFQEARLLIDFLLVSVIGLVSQLYV
jgi:hypothetical protein